MNIFRKLQGLLRLKEAVRQADNAHERTGERYYVMPTSGTSGHLTVIDRKNFRKLKQKGYINRKSHVNDLERECFYCTTYQNGGGQLPVEVMEAKLKQYYSWLDSVTKQKDNGKVRKH